MTYMYIFVVTLIPYFEKAVNAREVIKDEDGIEFDMVPAFA